MDTSARYHRSPSAIIARQPLSFARHLLSSLATRYHRSPSAIIAPYPLSSLATRYHRFPPVIIPLTSLQSSHPRCLSHSETPTKSKRYQKPSRRTLTPLGFTNCLHRQPRLLSRAHAELAKFLFLSKHSRALERP